MKKFISFFVIINLLLINKAVSQYRMPVYNDYLTDNYYVLHPAMAGAHFEGVKVRASYRTQWLGIKNPPSVQSLNIHARVSQKSGLGVLFFHDQNGFQSQIGAQFTYAHHINFFRSNAEVNQLSFGLTVGASNYKHDQTSFDLSSGDPLVLGDFQKSFGGYVDLGITYNLLNLYAHLTIQNLLFKGKDISDEVILAKPRRIFTSLGNFFEVNNKWALEPSLMLDVVEFAERPNIDLNLKTHHSLRDAQIWGGFSYRNGLTQTLAYNQGTQYSQSFNQLSAITGFSSKKWTFSYTYTFALNDIKISNSGFHQFTLGFDLFSDEFTITTVRGIL